MNKLHTGSVESRQKSPKLPNFDICRRYRVLTGDSSAQGLPCAAVAVMVVENGPEPFPRD